MVERRLIRWAGSKKKLLPVLKMFWEPTCKRYVEPFAGSAQLFFELKPQEAIVGDLNKDLIETYLAVRESPKKVFRKVRDFRNGKKEYLRLRSMNFGHLSEAYKAARFIFLNQNCFNGLYRTNKAGKFNVPYAKGAYFPLTEKDFTNAAACLQSTILLHGDFSNTLRHVRSGDFVYMDPPYFVEGNKYFTDYTAKGFGEKDLARLEGWLEIIDKRKAKFLLSYAFSEKLEKRFKRWNQHKKMVFRNIAGFATKRKKVKELLITNFLTKRSSL